MYIFKEPVSITKITEQDSKLLANEDTLLRFQPFSSSLDPNFWFKVFQLKLEVDKLDEVHRPLIGYYNSKCSPYMTLDCSSFNQYVFFLTIYIIHI